LSTRPRANDAILIPVSSVRRVVTIIVVLALVLIAGAVLVAQRERIRLALGGTEAAYIDTTTYQSVVLVTNQVYFGRLRIDGDVYTLSDVYSFSANSDASTGQVQLVKRGSELHGPEEPLVIPGRSVLFFENMRTDSEVVQAIGKIRSGQTSTPPPATASPQRSASPSPSR
jgi:hypothetical protein